MLELKLRIVSKCDGMESVEIKLKNNSVAIINYKNKDVILIQGGKIMYAEEGIDLEYSKEKEIFKIIEGWKNER